MRAAGFDQTPAAPRFGGLHWLANAGRWVTDPENISMAVIIAMVAVVLLAVLAIQPPTVEQIEQDIWNEWVLRADIYQGYNLADLIRQQNIEDPQQRPSTAQLEHAVRTTGELLHGTERYGRRLIVPTYLWSLEVFDANNRSLASWRLNPDPKAQPDANYQQVTVPVLDGPSNRVVGRVAAVYRFYAGQIDTLPMVQSLRWKWVWAVVAALALGVVLVATLQVGRALLHQRLEALRRTELILGVAKQMTHELRNGLWSFSLETKGFQQLFDTMDRFGPRWPELVEQAAERLNLEPAARRRLVRTVSKSLADERIDPETDLQPLADSVRPAADYLSNFARYMTLLSRELEDTLRGRDEEVRELVPTSIGDIWREAVGLIGWRMRIANVTVQENLATTDDVIMGDEMLLLQIFLNLTKNAIEAMREQPEPREIRFHLEETPDGQGVLATVSNTGPPIPPEIMARMFERGFSTKEKKGRGEGLTVVAESVQKLGGELWFASDAADGTQFQMRFPKAHPGVQPAAAAAAAAP